MSKNKKRTGPKKISPYNEIVEKRMKATYDSLNEKEQRKYAAIETFKLPHGGQSYISGLFGCSRNRIIRGLDELKNPDKVPEDRIRKKGGGRKESLKIIENIDQVFLKVIDDYIAGDPMNPEIRWTNLSPVKIADRMAANGLKISVTVVKKLLKKHKFVKRKMQKSQPIGKCDNRNDQFEKIALLKKNISKMETL
jgi:hypothetical protein